ncbi:1432_t:CDS:2 [Paraglomus occultum]|uniref:1432_t:CDS:1 n=1 Tax=Paraglomus occultum TaxID=144539 RepID=A0A9N8VKU2_9GLOM|nr:1432_t:CDS:2 [Paraglomus occultum]
MGSKIPFVGGLFKTAGETVEGDKKTTGTPSVADIITGKKYGELLGAKTEDKQTQNKDQSENEQQTKRQKASTAKNTFNSATAIGEEDTEFIPGEDKRETKQEVPANSAVSGHMGIFPVDNPNKDYFSELCADDMNANSVNPGTAAASSTG